MIYVFDDYALDTEIYALDRAGEPVKLEHQVFKVLTYLIEHRDHVVAKQELFTQLWPDRFVSDKALERCIQMARRALGDPREAPRFIQTLRSRGYRFIGNVRPGSPSLSPLPEPLIDRAASSPQPPPWPEGQQGPPATVPALPLSADVRHCPVCHQVQGAEATFCFVCGQRLGEVVLHSSPTPDGERKQVTVLVCVLTDATLLASHLGPETMFNLMQELFALAQSEVQRYEGTITQFRGGGFMALFGAPLAHEDHARRAVLAALALRQRFREEAMTLRLPVGETLGVRMGLHTGLVVVGSLGDGAQRTYTAMGATTQLADRLQQCAEPGTILASAATIQLLRGDVRVEEWGLVDNPGKTEPVLAYRVIATQPRRSPWAGRRERPLSRFVGRMRELAFLHERLTQVEHGEGQVVGIVGEPGLGKSRLLYEFRQGLQEQRATYLEGRCLSYGRTVPYLPVLDLLRQHCGITDADHADAVINKVDLGLQGVGLEPATWAPYLLYLLGVQDARGSLSSLSPEAMKTRTLEALWQMSLAASRQGPLILVVEDLHWIDATSEECFASLVERMAGAPVLCLFTYRPGYRPPWIEKSYTTQIALSRLAPNDGLRMVQSMLHTAHIPDTIIQAILAKTEGNPFFLEELSRSVIEQGEGHVVPVVPDTVQAVLAARIDRLPPEEKRLLQAAAVIGKEVLFPLLQAIIARPEEEVQRGLRHLQATEFLYELRLAPERVYTFKHTLTQEVAYQSLLQRTRQQYHRQIAQVLEERFPEVAETQPVLLAHHYTEAGFKKEAIVYWYRAGQRAIERSAHVEAIGHLTKGLEVLKALPDTPERTQQELTLHITLGSPLIATKGYAAQEVEQAYIRARELCQQIGDTTQLFSALVGLWRCYYIRAELQTAHTLGEQLLNLVQRVQDVSCHVVAHFTLGATLFMLGELAPARAHLEQGIALYDVQQHHPMVSLYGSDLGVPCLSYAAWALWWLGYPDQALNRIHEAVILARQFAYPFDLAFAFGMVARLHHLRREGQIAQERAEKVIALSAEQEFPFWVAQGTIIRGWALVEQGRKEEGMAQIHQGLGTLRATGAKLALPVLLTLLAEAYAKGGQIEDGLTVLTDAFAVVPRGGSHHYYMAELYRLKGEFLLVLSLENQAEAEAHFHQALDIACRQSAKSLELRAAMSLSRLWQRQGKHAAAHQMLAEIYSWFTEGFDTLDLQEAKALLQELV